MGEWRKAIPEKRDRFQSRVLVWVVGPLLLFLMPNLVLMAIHSPEVGRYGLKALGVSLTFAVLVWALRAATPAAAFFGGVICVLVIEGTRHFDRSVLISGLAPLMALFLLTFVATKAGKPRKVRLGLAEGKHGRNAAQVVANLGAAGLVVVGCALNIFDRFSGSNASGLFSFSVMALPALLLAALCESTADTVSSEIGQAFGGRPIMLTTFRRVEAGTDGAVSVLGSVAGLAGAAVVAVVGMWAMQMTWQDAATGLAGGTAGWVFDSVLGATVERRGWLGNDLVNFGSTVVAVVVALGLLRVL